jgi:dihydrofolate reductase
MSTIVYIAASLDGFIAKKDGDIKWLLDIQDPENSDFGFYDFLNTIDAVVMGRKTFELVSTFKEWPYNKPVFILSRTLYHLPYQMSGKAEILKGKPASIVKELNSRGYINLYIDGGKTIQGFLKDDLIDQLIITRIPILLGEGIPLFGKLSPEQKFEHLKTDILNNALVRSYYKRLKYN